MTHHIRPTQAELLEKARRKAEVPQPPPAEHEGATEEQTGDRTGPGGGYDNEPEQVRDKGGVA